MHCGSPFEPAGFRALRMPLYFVLSGLFFKDYGGFKPTIWKKVNKLIIPFFFFYLIAYCIIQLNFHIKGTIDECPYLMFDFITKTEYFNRPIWFLLCLFWDNLIFLSIIRITKNEIIRGTLVLLTGLTGYCLICKSITLPIQLSPALNSLPFFYLGYLLKRTTLLYPSERKIFEWGLIIVLLGVGVGISSFLDQPCFSFLENEIHGNLIIIYITSAAMVIGTLLLCKQIGRLPIISYIGRYSIILLGIHWVIIHYLHKIVAPLPYSTHLTFVLTVVISGCLIPIFTKYCPYFTAQKDFDFKSIGQKASTFVKRAYR